MPEQNTGFPLIEGPFSKVSRRQRMALEQLSEKISSSAYGLQDVSCLCESERGILLAKKDRYGFPIDTLLCRNCGLIRSTPQLDQESLRRFYESEYREIYSSSKRSLEKHFASQRHKGKQIQDFLSDIGIANPLSKVYDFGCGGGGTLIPFIEEGAEARGYELSKDYVSYGKQQGLDLTTDENLFFNAREKADLIIMSHVLEHLPDPSSKLKQLRGLLKEEGIIYVEVPGVLSIHENYKNFMFSLQQAHVWNFDLTTLNNLMSSAGYEIVKGNERIHSAFKKSDPKKYSKIPLEYEKIMSYIQGIQRRLSR